MLENRRFIGSAGIEATMLANAQIEFIFHSITTPGSIRVGLPNPQKRIDDLDCQQTSRYTSLQLAIHAEIDGRCREGQPRASESRA